MVCTRMMTSANPEHDTRSKRRSSRRKIDYQDRNMTIVNGYRNCRGNGRETGSHQHVSCNSRTPGSAPLFQISYTRDTANLGVTSRQLFINCRSTRRTELQRQYPNHVINKWLGHSSAVAERHYLQVTKDDWADGATRETVCKNRQITPQSDDHRCRPYDSGGNTGGNTHDNTGGHSRMVAQKKPVKTRLHAPTGSGIAAQATPQGLEP